MAETFWQRRIRGPVIQLLKQGLTPEKLALTIALGIALGTIPVLGSTSIACAAAAAVLGLNQAAIQGVNYLVYPLQIALIIPFLRLGSVVFGDGSFHLGFDQIKALAQSGVVEAIGTLWTVTVHGVAAWALIAWSDTFSSSAQAGQTRRCWANRRSGSGTSVPVDM